MEVNDMKEKTIMERQYCAGNLAEELSEFQKLDAMQGETKRVLTTTSACGTFLTLRCC